MTYQMHALCTPMRTDGPVLPGSGAAQFVVVTDRIPSTGPPRGTTG